MGMNFYARHIPSKLEYAKMREALENKDLKRLRKLIDEAEHQYHIGKRSDGWQFQFVPHIKTREGFWNTGKIISPWEDNYKSIRDYLSRSDVEIVDEEGNVFTVDQFFNEEIGYCLYHNSETAINGEDYDNNQEKYPHRIPIGKMEYTTGEGLRFATDDDWS